MMNGPVSASRRAIIALLISILLPSLKGARDQAKKAKCLANLHNLGVAAASYLHDERDRFCFGPGDRFETNNGQTVPVFRTWYFGGNEFAGTTRFSTASVNNWPATRRPLNRYVYATNKLGNGRDLRVYECPSDTGIRLDDDPFSKPTGVTAYDEVGSSYDVNLNWSYYSIWCEKGFQRQPDRCTQLGNIIIRMMQKKAPKRFILLDEDPADWVLANTFNPGGQLPNGYKLIGWHGKANMHNMAFLDGRADAVYIDPAKNRHSSFYITRHGTNAWLARHDFLAERLP
jgi:type II secretory pathway pseudopilin PulG